MTISGLRSGASGEVAIAAMLGVCVVGSRLVFVTAFPTTPVSDFSSLVHFAVGFRDTGLAAGHPGWQFFGVGLPFLLSLVLRMVAGDPVVVARYTTAVVTGAAALVPFIVWRGILGLPARLAASLLLGLWPGHVFFSGVVAQDNWLLFPSVLLACLAIRAQRIGRVTPMGAAVALGMAAAIRQEMLLVLLPLGIEAAGLRRASPDRLRRGLVWTSVTAIILTGAAALRWTGTGQFRLTTEHGGLAVLGAMTPGAVGYGWTFPQIYFAAHRPELIEDWEGMKRESFQLAWKEFARRPVFHAARGFESTVNALALSDAASLFWSLEHPAALPPELHPRAAALLRHVRRPFLAATVAAVIVALASLLLAVRHRDVGIALIGVAAVLKLGVHALTVAQSRYFLVVVAFGLLMCVLAGDLVARKGLGREAWIAVLAAGAVMLVVLAAARVARGYLLRNEEQLTYRFTLRAPDGDGVLHCVIRKGLLTHVDRSEAGLRSLSIDPAAGDAAAAECKFEGSAGRPAALEFRHSHSRGRLPNGIHQVVTVDGREVVRHDVGAHPGEDWLAVGLDPVEPGQGRSVVLEIVAVQSARAAAVTTSFRLVPRPAG